MHFPNFQFKTLVSRILVAKNLKPSMNILPSSSLGILSPHSSSVGGASMLVDCLKITILRLTLAANHLGQEACFLTLDL